MTKIRAAATVAILRVLTTTANLPTTSSSHYQCQLKTTTTSAILKRITNRITRAITTCRPLTHSTTSTTGASVW